MGREHGIAVVCDCFGMDWWADLPPGVAMSFAADTDLPTRSERVPYCPPISFNAPRADAPCPVQRGSFPLRLTLRHGGVHDLVLRWQLFGVQEAPLCIVLGGISANRQLAANAVDGAEGWWPQQVRRGGALDPWSFRLLSIDWLGADGSLDAVIDADDQAQALVALLEHLQVARVAACVGASYGAMVGLQLAKRLGTRLGHLVVLNAAHRAHPFASAWRALQRRIVRLGAAHADTPEGVAIARALAVLSYRTPAEFATRFTSGVEVENDIVRCAAEPYLEAQGERFAARFAATAYLRLSESIDLHRIEPVDVPVPVTVFAARSDQLVPVEDVRELAVALPLLHRYHEVDSLYGHDAFLKEDERVHAVLVDALATTRGVA
jgi:homoserine O-acetyltransferase/O-succinyltransferase